MMTTRPKLGIVTETGDIRQVVWRDKSSWIEKIPFMKITQIVFGVVTMLALISGQVFFAAKEWRASAISLVIAFFALFVLWGFEHMKCFYLRRELSRTNNYENENP